jgi:hypothetical protein
LESPECPDKEKNNEEIGKSVDDACYEEGVSLIDAVGLRISADFPVVLRWSGWRSVSEC